MACQVKSHVDKDLITRISGVILTFIIIFILAGCRQSSNRSSNSQPVGENGNSISATLGQMDGSQDSFQQSEVSIAAIPGAACVPDKQAVLAEVVKVVDGDTIHVEIDGVRYKVRYIGIDTPEEAREDSTAEYFSNEATKRNVELVDGRVVRLISDVSDTDQYGRKLFYIFIDDLFVNYELVRKGYARSVTFPPDVACTETLKEAERLARAEGIGLWSE